MAKAPGLTIDWTGMRCPRCSYVRALSDRVPVDACPRCSAPYAESPAPPAPGWAAAVLWDAALKDRSLHVLIAVNVLTLAFAFYQGMSLRSLLLIYWIQSVIIVACSVARILILQRFSTRGVSFDGEKVIESAATRRKAASGCAMFFGIFHAVYLAFIFVFPPPPQFGDPMAYVLAGLVFALNHLYSLRRNAAKDAAGRPNIGTLMFMPLPRILPMHLLMCTGLAFTSSAFSMVLFGLLKTAADALMHLIEHRVLQSEPEQPQL